MTPNRDRACDAFGRPLREPQTRAERIAALRRLAGALQADSSIEVRWLGRCIADWLRCGGTLDAALGVDGVPTAAQIVQRERVDLALLKFAATLGSDARAARVLNGIEPCPPALSGARDELLLLGIGRSDRALRRARMRTRSGAASVRM